LKEDGPRESLLVTKEFLVEIKEASFYYPLTNRKLEIEEVVMPKTLANFLREYEDM